jgi:hypothetical protein
MPLQTMGSGEGEDSTRRRSFPALTERGSCRESELIERRERRKGGMEEVDKDDEEEKAEGSTVKEGLKNTPFSQRELSSSASRSPEESS